MLTTCWSPEGVRGPSTTMSTARLMSPSGSAPRQQQQAARCCPSCCKAVHHRSLRPPAGPGSNLNPIRHAAISPKNTASSDIVVEDEPFITKTTTNCPKRASSDGAMLTNLKSLLFLAVIFLLFSACQADASAFGAAAAAASASATGGLLPFPEGRGPDGTLYKTDYRCEGENMTVSCEASDGPGLDGTIQVVRANFGRFSIAICNRHGQTDWNVNCFAPQTTKILQQKCDGKSRCVVEVNSSNFHDACPGTLKYLEIHYACTSTQPSQADTSNVKQPELPPWLIDRKKSQADDSVRRGAKNRAGVKKLPSKADQADQATSTTSSTLMVRKPILVTDRPGTGGDHRVPITTPSTTSSTTTSPTTTTEETTTVTTTRRRVTKAPPRVEVTTRRQITTTTTQQQAFPFEGPSYNPLSPASANGDDVTSVNNRFVVTSSLDSVTSSSCPPKTARQLQWDWTPAGQPAIQPCPIGATGLAKWACLEEGGKGAAWAPAPDMSGCKSVAVDNLEAQVRKEDPETVLVSSLAYLTRTRSLYGGDLESTVGIMRTVASRLTYRLQSGRSFHNRESHVRQVVQDVLRSASNILEDSNRQAWMDLQPNRQKKVATNLLLALEENAFLLAGVIDEPTNILETQEIMTMAISVVDTAARYGGYADRKSVKFPEKPLLFVDDGIEVPRRDLEDNSNGNGVAETVFFSYSTLHQILGMHGGSYRLSGDVPAGADYALNSRVISASLGRAGRHADLAEPVTVELRHLRQENVTGPVCVFWDYEVHAWSDRGCRLLETNVTHSKCACDHLTNFALLMRTDSNGGAGINIRLDIVASVVAAVVVLGILVALVKYRRRFFEWCSCCCRRNLNFRKSSGPQPGGGVLGGTASCFCCSTGTSSKHNLDNKCQSFYTGLSSQNHSQYVLTGQPLQAQSLLHNSTSHDHFQRAATLHHHNQMALQQQQAAAAGHHQMAGHNNAMTLNGIKTLRPHITLNPYSTQLVESINLMMPNNNNSSTGSSEDSGNGSENSDSRNFRENSSTIGRQAAAAAAAADTTFPPQLAQLTNTLRGGQDVFQPHQQADAANGDVVYRAVSPHGHVYWEIDPGQVYAAAVAANAGGHLPEENVSLLISGQQQAEPSELRPLMSPMILTANSELASQQQQQRPGPFVRNRWRQQQQQQNNSRMNQEASNVMQGDVLQSILQSPPPPPPGQPPSQQTVGNEHLQTQVQIRDIKPIQVSVKSSEYIEAKIRTMRNNNSRH